jgi:acyl-CoA reductase-like NAD-dependent aldehyde dehydrogenase
MNNLVKPRSIEASRKSLVEEAYHEAQRLSGHVIVDGKLFQALASDSFDVENSADETVIGRVPRCRDADVDRAVQSAARAFPMWSALPARERGDRIRKIADRLEAEGEHLARLLCLETGNALTTQARPEIVGMLEHLRFFAGLASELKGSTLPWASNGLCYTTREPLGVVAAIIPWNAPLFLTGAKLGPALVAGNTVVLKTAEQAPLAALRAVEIMQEFLLPGVANVISGYGKECGKPLAEHPLVRKVTFTGSGAVGKQILHYAADKICPVTLELGGKGPNIVLPDADLNLVIPGIVQGVRFTRQGQSCSAGTRLFLHEDIYETVMDRLVDALGRLRIGPPMDEATEIGAIISREQFERVCRYVEIARTTPGAKIRCGGGRPADPALAKGYFFAPTLIEGIPHESPVCQEEIFGPVASVFPWRDFSEVMRLANAVDYGLSAALWTRDLNRALDFAQHIQAGFVQVNQFITPRASLAYGGWKTSGLGKECSLESMLDHFTQSKTVIINSGTPGV